jgi:hypothetical protein
MREYIPEERIPWGVGGSNRVCNASRDKSSLSWESCSMMGGVISLFSNEGEGEGVRRFSDPGPPALAAGGSVRVRVRVRVRVKVRVRFRVRVRLR